MLRRPERALTTRTVVAALLVGALAACSSGPSPDVGARSAVVPTQVALAPGPGPVPALTALPSPPPAGTVERRTGPFDDRYQLLSPSLLDGVAAATLVVTSDVSKLLTVELAADFYDQAGRLLGSASTIYGEDHNPDPAAQDSQAEKDGVRLTVAADPVWRAQVNSVVLGIPSLVNE